MDKFDRSNLIIWQLFENLSDYSLDEMAFYFYLPEKGYVHDVPIGKSSSCASKLRAANIWSYGDLLKSSYVKLVKDFGIREYSLEEHFDFVREHISVRIIPKMKPGYRYRVHDIDSFFSFLKTEGITVEKLDSTNRDYLVRALSNTTADVPFTEDSFYEYLKLLSNRFPIDFWIEEAVIHKLNYLDPFGITGHFFANKKIEDCLNAQVNRIIDRNINKGIFEKENSTVCFFRKRFEDLLCELESQEKESIFEEIDSMDRPSYHMYSALFRNNESVISDICEENGILYEDGFGKIYKRFNIDDALFSYVFNLSRIQMYFIKKRYSRGYNGIEFFMNDDRIPESIKRRMRYAIENKDYELKNTADIRSHYKTNSNGKVELARATKELKTTKELKPKKEIKAVKETKIKSETVKSSFSLGALNDYDKKYKTIEEENLNDEEMNDFFENFDEDDESIENYGSLFDIDAENRKIENRILLIPSRLRRALKEAKLKTIGDILNTSPQRLYLCNGFGIGTEEALKRILTAVKNNNPPYTYNRPLVEEMDEEEPLYVLLNYGSSVSAYKSIRIKNTKLKSSIIANLNGHGINNLSKLLECSIDGLKQKCHFGNTSIQSIVKFLKDYKEIDDIIVSPGFPVVEIEDKPCNIGISLLDRYRESKNTIGEILRLDAENYRYYSISSFSFGKRLQNLLMRHRINSAEDVLLLKPKELFSIAGFGKECASELSAYLIGLTSNSNVEEIDERVLEHKNEIILGDFSFLDDSNDGLTELCLPYKIAYEELDSDLINEVLNNRTKIKNIIKLLDAFSKKDDRLNLIKSKNQKRLSNAAINYIYAFKSDSDITSFLEGLIETNDITLGNYINVLNKNRNNENSIIIDTFIDWCSFDIWDDIRAFFSALASNEREYAVILLRSQNQTLEMIAQKQNCTRERIRQIEVKAKRKFQEWRVDSRILFKICADRNGDKVLQPEELIEYFGEYYAPMMYMLKSSQNEGIYYDKALDIFIIGGSLSELLTIRKRVEKLPEYFTNDELSNILKRICEHDLYPEELVELIIQENYTLHDNCWIKGNANLTLTEMYSNILGDYYPNGIHVYDSSELVKFKYYVEKRFGINMDKSDRSIISIISRAGILCGRGTYKRKEAKESYISVGLRKRIYDFVEYSKQPILLTGAIYSKFEKDLRREGINNRYYLHGILKEYYDDQWFFRRDYISRDNSSESLYDSIISYIRKSKRPRSKEEIRKAFPGITEIVISCAVLDPDIINLFGSYIHIDNIIYTKKDKDYLRKVLDLFLEKNEYIHAKLVYEYVLKDNPAIWKRNYVTMSFSAFSLLEGLFRYNYKFMRPFIGRKNAKIERTEKALQNYVAESSTIEIEDIRFFARERKYAIYSILDLINTFNDTHLLVDNYKLMKIEDVGVTKEIVNQLETEILKEIKDETIPINCLACAVSFPKISVPWHEWLVYSVLKKWSGKLDVAASNSVFNRSIPLVSRKGKMDTSMYSQVDKSDYGNLSSADDLDDIDSLIEEYIFEEDDDE